MLRTRVGRWFAALVVLPVLLIVGIYVVRGVGDFGQPYVNGDNARPHKINGMRDHDGGILRILIAWRGIKPSLIVVGPRQSPERLLGPQVPENPSHVVRVYTYHPGYEYVATAEQDDSLAEGPLDCEITLDGIHVDGDRLSHGRGQVECWMYAA